MMKQKECGTLLLTENIINLMMQESNIWNIIEKNVMIFLGIRNNNQW